MSSYCPFAGRPLKWPRCAAGHKSFPGGHAASKAAKSTGIGAIPEILGKTNAPALSRRSFLKGAGVGSLALASLPTLGSALARKAFAGELLSVHLVTVSQPPGQPAPSPATPADWLIVGGGGHLHGDALIGGGSFVHVLVPGLDVPPPWDVAGWGTWRFGKVTNWDLIGTAVGFAAGVLEFWAEINITGGELEGTSVSLPARIVCNLEPAGLDTHQIEGFYLQGTPAGNFEPILPPGGAFPLGFTAFLVQ